jgi:hypothetical protein
MALDARINSLSGMKPPGVGQDAVLLCQRFCKAVLHPNAGELRYTSRHIGCLPNAPPFFLLIPSGEIHGLMVHHLLNYGAAIEKSPSLSKLLERLSGQQPGCGRKKCRSTELGIMLTMRLYARGHADSSVGTRAC